MEPKPDTVNAIVGLGLLLDCEWSGEGIVEVLRGKCSLPIDASMMLA